jgi:hypothetical protein
MTQCLMITPNRITCLLYLVVEITKDAVHYEFEGMLVYKELL